MVHLHNKSINYNVFKQLNYFPAGCFHMNVDTRQTFILELLLLFFKQNCQNLSRVMELKYLCVLDQTSRLKTFLQVW